MLPSASVFGTSIHTDSFSRLFLEKSLWTFATTLGSLSLPSWVAPVLLLKVSQSASGPTRTPYFSDVSHSFESFDSENSITFSSSDCHRLTAVLDSFA